MSTAPAKWKFAVDRGGTFTDITGLDPAGTFHVLKLLSSSPEYDDSSIEGIRQVMGLQDSQPLPAEEIESIRFGSTVATNALLERKGGRVLLLVTEGFSDLFEIGYQNRPDIFSLCIKKPAPLYSEVIEVSERIDAGGTVVRQVETGKLREDIRRLKAVGIETAAVILMHSWRNPEHELACETILKEEGLSSIFLSHKTSNLIKIVSRGQATIMDAYLGPVITGYLKDIKHKTGKIPISFMRSSGTLADPESFRGKDAILSGPAGGMIAVASIACKLGLKGAIGFDMGGTSTDVSRVDGRLEKVHERLIEGTELQTEMLNIVTVASGGGSRLWFDGQKMRVGPESAGAYPGPACYGFGGPLTITDANFLTGRIVTGSFPAAFGTDRRSPPDLSPVRKKFKLLKEKLLSITGSEMSIEEIALGFLTIANEKMAMAIKEISVSKGFDIRDYALVSFGGAGGQHACQVASLLGIEKIIFHPLSGLISAYGIGISRPAVRSVLTCLKPCTPDTYRSLAPLFNKLTADTLKKGGTGYRSYNVKHEIDLRVEGTDSFQTFEYLGYEETLAAFEREQRRLFGFFTDDTGIEIVNLRVEVQSEETFFSEYNSNLNGKSATPLPLSRQNVYYPGGSANTPVYNRSSLCQGAVIKAPAIVVDSHSTLIIDPGFTAEISSNGIITLLRTGGKDEHLEVNSTKPDPILLEVFNNAFSGIAVEMGVTLRNTAHSVNIKERLDFSCAVFDRSGELVANAPHIPVHLGSMSDTVKAVIYDHKRELKPGDFFLTNNPYRGGSHLPDITIIAPFFSEDGKPAFYTAARGHHSDIGGITPGSMPPFSGHIEEEGILIESKLLVRNGIFREKELMDILTGGKYPARNIGERLSDLRAQVAACSKGIGELKELIGRFGWKTVSDYMIHIQENAEAMVKKALADFLDGNGRYMGSFEDCLDDGTKLAVTVAITGGSNPPETIMATIDFSGTGSQHSIDNLNTPLSVTRSAVLYVIRALTGVDIPLNSGCLKPVDIIIPDGSILSPSFPSPVASGNVETSQRIVDVLLGAFRVAAASQGTMNNLIFEVEGSTPYYETIGGGSGAMDGCHGGSGVQVHMTNTRSTDPEVLEHKFPAVRLDRFTLRKGSGGIGLYRGGNGIIKEVTFLKPAAVNVISERRVYAPYGLQGGGKGKRGVNLLRKTSGTTEVLGHRDTVNIQKGDSIIIKTPGGGGFGESPDG